MEDIFDLIINGNLAGIRKIFDDQNISTLMTARDANQCTPLICAIKEKKPRIFDFFLSHCQVTDVNALDGAST